jgi:hypothetical protein
VEKHASVGVLRLGCPRQLNADNELCDGDGGHRYFVIVIDDLVEPGSRPVGVNEERRVEKKSQVRVSISSSSRAMATSREKPGSR